MAKRSPYGKKPTLTGRRLVMSIILIMAVAAAIWRITLPSADTTDDTGRSGQSLTGENGAIQVSTSNENSQQKTATAGLTASSSTVPPANTTTTTPPPPEVVVTPPPATLVSQAETLLKQGLAAQSAKNYFAASTKLTQAITAGLDNKGDTQARQAINEVADIWLFSRNVYQGDLYSSRYRVAPGDRLVDIAQKYNTPYRFLMRINRIKNASSLQAGQMLKVVRGPFHVKVDCRRFLMSVYLGETLVRSYQVSTGKSGMETPLGQWRVQMGKKQINPAWVNPETGKKYWPDDKDNPLGERWIGIEGLKGQTIGRTGFGIHGTIEPDKLGSAASHGCIRLANKNVEELYDMLIEVKSTVTTFE